MTSWRVQLALASLLVLQACNALGPQAPPSKTRRAPALPPQQRLEALASVLDPQRYATLVQGIEAISTASQSGSPLPIDLLSFAPAKGIRLFSGAFSQADAVESPSPANEAGLKATVDPKTGELTAMEGRGYRLALESLGLTENTRTQVFRVLESPIGWVGELRITRIASAWIPAPSRSPRYRVMGDEAPAPGAEVSFELTGRLQEQGKANRIEFGMKASDFAKVQEAFQPQKLSGRLDVNQANVTMDLVLSPSQIQSRGRLVTPNAQGKPEGFPWQATLQIGRFDGSEVRFGSEATDVELVVKTLPLPQVLAAPEPAAGAVPPAETATAIQPDQPASMPIAATLLTLSGQQKLADLELQGDPTKGEDVAILIRPTQGAPSVWPLAPLMKQLSAWGKLLPAMPPPEEGPPLGDEGIEEGLASPEPKPGPRPKPTATPTLEATPPPETTPPVESMAPVRETVVVSGTVYDEGGAKLDGVWMEVRASDPNFNYSASTSTSRGVYVFNQIPVGEMLIFKASLNGFESREIQRVILKQDGKLTVNFGGPEAADAPFFLKRR